MEDKAILASNCRKVKYSKLFSLGNYENEKIELEDYFDYNLDDELVITSLHERVEDMHKTLELKRKQEKEEIVRTRMVEAEARKEATANIQMKLNELNAYKDNLKAQICLKEREIQDEMNKQFTAIRNDSTIALELREIEVSISKAQEEKAQLAKELDRKYFHNSDSD